MKHLHILTVIPKGKARVQGKCSCGKWKLTGFETSVRNTHRQHLADEARKN